MAPLTAVPTRRVATTAIVLAAVTPCCGWAILSQAKGDDLANSLEEIQGRNGECFRSPSSFPATRVSRPLSLLKAPFASLCQVLSTDSGTTHLKAGGKRSHPSQETLRLHSQTQILCSGQVSLAVRYLSPGTQEFAMCSTRTGSICGASSSRLAGMWAWRFAQPLKAGPPIILASSSWT
jgi:hypothetical protein